MFFKYFNTTMFFMVNIFLKGKKSFANFLKQPLVLKNRLIIAFFYFINYNELFYNNFKEKHTERVLRILF